MATFDELGRQVPDPRPVEVPVGLKRPLTLQEEIKRFVRSELSTRAAAEGVETFEEADDFELDEDPDLVHPTEYEMVPEGARDASDLTRPEPGPPPPPATQDDAGRRPEAAEASGSALGTGQTVPVGSGKGGGTLPPTPLLPNAS